MREAKTTFPGGPHGAVSVPDVVAWIHEDQVRRQILALVDKLAPEAWIGAGFVRNRLWDVVTERTTPLTDVDVLVFSRDEPTFAENLQKNLVAAMPGVAWDVRNQAHMHSGNGHPPYVSVADAVARFPETATALAIRGKTLLAPYGLGDAVELRLRPTPWGGPFAARVASKPWRALWPELTVETAFPTTCAGWLAYGGWAPIRDCPGRWVWAAGFNPQIARFGDFVPWQTWAPDPVWAAELPDGGFIAYVAADRTVLTLGNTAGFARKRAALLAPLASL